MWNPIKNCWPVHNIATLNKSPWLLQLPSGAGVVAGKGVGKGFRPSVGRNRWWLRLIRAPPDTLATVDGRNPRRPPAFYALMHQRHLLAAALMTL